MSFSSWEIKRRRLEPKIYVVVVRNLIRQIFPIDRKYFAFFVASLLVEVHSFEYPSVSGVYQGIHSRRQISVFHVGYDCSIDCLAIDSKVNSNFRPGNFFKYENKQVDVGRQICMFRLMEQLFVIMFVQFGDSHYLSRRFNSFCLLCSRLDK